MPEEGVDLGPQRIRVFISGNSGNKEMVTHQQRIIMVLQSLGIDTEVLDIAAPGMDEARDFMRGGAKKKENQRNVLPPQIFNGDTYCGDYDDFDVANEDDHLEEFLGIPKQGSDLKEGGDAVDGQDPTKLEGQPAVNGEPEKSEASKEDIEDQVPENESTKSNGNGTNPQSEDVEDDKRVRTKREQLDLDEKEVKGGFQNIGNMGRFLKAAQMMGTP